MFPEYSIQRENTVNYMLVNMLVNRNFNIHVPSSDLKLFLICHCCLCIDSLHSDSLHSFVWFHRPHLFDYSDQLDKTPVDCCENAFSVAEQFLDVDRLLEPSGTVTAFIICLFLIKLDINFSLTNKAELLQLRIRFR